MVFLRGDILNPRQHLHAPKRSQSQYCVKGAVLIHMALDEGDKSPYTISHTVQTIDLFNVKEI